MPGVRLLADPGADTGTPGGATAPVSYLGALLLRSHPLSLLPVPGTALHADGSPGAGWEFYPRSHLNRKRETERFAPGAGPRKMLLELVEVMLFK